MTNAITHTRLRRDGVVELRRIHTRLVEQKVPTEAIDLLVQRFSYEKPPEPEPTLFEQRVMARFDTVADVKRDLEQMTTRFGRLEATMAATHAAMAAPPARTPCTRSTGSAPPSGSPASSPAAVSAAPYDLYPVVSADAPHASHADETEPEAEPEDDQANEVAALQAQVRTRPSTQTTPAPIPRHHSIHMPPACPRKHAPQWVPFACRLSLSLPFSLRARRWWR
jgi:hypothetical protein